MTSRPKVLIIEDNPELRALLEQVLGAEYEVASAQAGGEGVRLATSFRPDVVILDLQLPDMPGVSAGRRIKRSSRTPILVLSATAGGDGADDILQSGCCDAFLAKPATLDEIRSHIAELIATAGESAP